MDTNKVLITLRQTVDFYDALAWDYHKAGQTEESRRYKTVREALSAVSYAISQGLDSEEDTA